MKNLLFVIFLSLTMTAYCQDSKINVQRFVYELTYKIDSTNRENSAKEVFFLDYANGKSKFCSEGQVFRDSVTRYWEAQLAAGAKSVNITKTSSTNFNFEILKNNANSIIFKQYLKGGTYYYTEDISVIKWKMIKGFENYNGYKVQKATTTYGGRNWNVLFTNSIPIPDGPYKFKNLPGLVVKAWDDNDDYTFNLIDSHSDSVYFDTSTPKKGRLLSKSEFIKAEYNYRNTSPYTPEELSQNPKFAQRDRELREKRKRQNNFIELK